MFERAACCIEASAAHTEQHDLVEWPGHREQPERAVPAHRPEDAPVANDGLDRPDARAQQGRILNGCAQLSGAAPQRRLT
jgi:hypothetical protein